MPPINTPNLNQLWANLIIEECLRNDIHYFCLASGHRSSPLACAVAFNKRAKSFIHYDERGVAFHALGYASAHRRPAVIISTSGTAAANFFPAVIEASKKKLPLLVLTADRPPELRETGAMQTIDQVGLFGRYVRWQFDLPCPTMEIAPHFILTSVDQAIHRAKTTPAGPVHLNCMFREPLEPVPAEPDLSPYLKDLNTWKKSKRPYTAYIRSDTAFKDQTRGPIISLLNQIRRGCIVVGKLHSPEEQDAVLSLAQKLNWPVFPDIASGLRLGTQHRCLIPHYDPMLLCPQILEEWGLDGVLHLGGRITSKRWYAYMEKRRPPCYIMVMNHPLRHDPLHNVTTRIQSDIAAFGHYLALSTKLKTSRASLSRLKEASDCVKEAIQQYVQKQKVLSEPVVAHLISLHIPENTGLFLGNSMPIRDMDMFAAADKNAVIVGGNRGASGIDGTLASAFGFCAGLRRPVTVMTGDLAFLHDLNSLKMHQHLNHPVVIIILNNNGGGIFSFLPIAQYTQVFERYFATPHDLHFEQASHMFGLNYAQPRTPEELIAAYTMTFVRKKSTVIEISIDRNDNVRIHQELQKHIVARLQTNA